MYANRECRESEIGAASMEYAILVAAIALVVIGAVMLLGLGVVDLLSGALAFR